MEDLEVGTCDTCGAEYPTWSREGRCGDCGECAEHCDHEEGELLLTQPESVPDFVRQLFSLSEKMNSKGYPEWAVEVRAIANCLAEGLGIGETDEDCEHAFSTDGENGICMFCGTDQIKENEME